jgi:cyclase
LDKERGKIMETIKIMPCLDMKDGRIVKGIHFVDLKDAGDPVENAEFYQKEGADELAMLDIAATIENRKTRLEIRSSSGRPRNHLARRELPWL